MRFPRSRRLLSASEYKFVFDAAIRSSDRYFTVLARANACRSPRLGLAITKKKVRLAVGRNRLKRIIRESFRQQPELAAADFVVLAGKHCMTASNRELFSSLNRHWQRVNEKCEP